MNHTCTHTSAGQTVMPALSEAEVRLVPDLAGQLSTLADPCQQTQPWFSEVTMSCEPEHLTNTSQNTVSFDNLTIKRWAPMVRVVYDYYPFGLSWENPKLPNDPEGVHDHAYQDKEFQFAEFSTGHGLALYDFHARMYDPATGRWLVPDPAEQFSNPYLAMANNPVMYVDPDGEWAHIVIGAAVGGTLNWAFNGAQFNAEGLGYFGVGALAGGLAAGVGAGVGAAIAGNAAAGGGFAAGFAGSATLGSTGFVAGAATGAAAGITNGLIQGTGNAMLGGQSFGIAFVDGGLNQAWRQGLSGAAIGGIAGGIQSAKNGGGFFESGTVKKTVIKNDIEPLKQKGNQNCLPCAGEAMAKADGIDLTQKQIRKDLRGNPNLDPIDDRDFGKYFARETNRYFGIRDEFDRADIFTAMNEGSHVVLSRQSSSGIGHALVLKKAVKKTFNFATSSTTHSYHFQIMNPSFGGFQGLQWGGVEYIMLQWLR